MSSVLSSAIAIAVALSSGETPPPSTPTPSTPTASADDIVHLRNGGFVRGTVEEYEPGGPVVLRKSDGTVRTVEAEDVARVEIAGAPEPAPSNAAVPDSAARVFLTRGDRRRGTLVLQRRTAGVFVSGSGGMATGLAWDNVCTAPCERLIDTNGGYTVNDLNKGAVLMSKTFTLDAYRGQDVTLEVRGGSVGMFVGGVLVSTLGGSLAAVSSLWFIDDDRSNAVGGAMLAAGVGGFVGGVIMLFRSRHRVRATAGRPR
jgi:hypothetical protein